RLASRTAGTLPARARSSAGWVIHRRTPLSAVAAGAHHRAEVAVDEAGDDEANDEDDEADQVTNRQEDDQGDDDVGREGPGSDPAHECCRTIGNECHGDSPLA